MENNKGEINSSDYLRYYNKPVCINKYTIGGIERFAMI